MKYYLFEVAQGDDKIKGKSVYDYNDLDLATANFHSKMGVAMKSELYTDELLVILDSDGYTCRAEHFVRPTE